ncbi:DUF6584 family protein [Streptomyces showdoensis]|uniref:Uncharacterized protein n=1 Tax=Streptomyces showdoensis TaxID=68268 RepID=A0A2P2GFS5_STREW|nr:DUF6584 family protein [Streptomyces showdoensis]KKZ70366.1 hypothetical protein VO63_29455 [Streptomyces showdoensis]
MPLHETLARVDADLAAGRVPMARQRLRGLVGSFPDDLALRRRLGEVYRLYGEPAEAGRWTYLEEDRDPAEVAAFEARYHAPGHRMKALAWSGPESAAGSAVARTRLAQVREECSRALGRPVDWSMPLEELEACEPVAEAGGKERLADLAAGAGCLLAVVAAIALWVNGLVALFG